MLTASIVIATYNRAHLLEETLQSLLSGFQVELHQHQVEVIVVDNNSKDETAQVVANFASTHSFIHYHLETKQGLSFARNRGIAEAKNEVVIFVDDDVEFAPNWFAELLAGFKEENVGMCGGKMLPFNTVLPDWLPARYHYLVGVVDLGDTSRLVPEVSGGNIAVRRSLFTEVGNFNVNLGRNGNQLMGGEEVELSMRIAKKGYKVFYNANAVVLHKIANKVNEKYIFDYVFLEGKSAAKIDKKIKAHKFYVKTLYSIFYTFSRSGRRNEKQFATKSKLLRYRYLKGYSSFLRQI